MKKKSIAGLIFLLFFSAWASQSRAEHVVLGDFKPSEVQTGDLQVDPKDPTKATLIIYKYNTDPPEISRKLTVSGEQLKVLEEMVAHPGTRWSSGKGFFGDYSGFSRISLGKIDDNGVYPIELLEVQLNNSLATSNPDHPLAGQLLDLPPNPAPLVSAREFFRKAPLEDRMNILVDMGDGGMPLPYPVRILGWKGDRLQVVSEEKLIRWMAGYDPSIEIFTVDPALLTTPEGGILDPGLSHLKELVRLRKLKPATAFINDLGIRLSQLVEEAKKEPQIAQLRGQPDYKYLLREKAWKAAKRLYLEYQTGKKLIAKVSDKVQTTMLPYNLGRGLEAMLKQAGTEKVNLTPSDILSTHNPISCVDAEIMLLNANQN